MARCVEISLFLLFCLPSLHGCEDVVVPPIFIGGDNYTEAQGTLLIPNQLVNLTFRYATANLSLDASCRILLETSLGETASSGQTMRLLDSVLGGSLQIKSPLTWEKNEQEQV